MHKFRNFIIALLAVFVFAIPAQAVQQDMWAYVYKWEGGMNADGTLVLTRLADSVRFWVQAEGSDTLETLYEFDDSANTSLTNPVSVANFESATVCNDRIAFSVDPTDSTNDRYVDLFVVMQDGGFMAFVENFDKYTHSVVIDARPGVEHHGAYRSAVIVSTTEVDTEVDFAYDTIVRAVTAEIITVDTGALCNIDVGIDTSVSGDVDGFIDGIDLTTAGFVDNTITTVGDLLDDGTDIEPVGYAIDSTDEQTLCYAGDSTGNSTGVVMIHYWFTRIR